MDVPPGRARAVAAPSTKLVVGAAVVLGLFVAAFFLPIGESLLSVVDYVRGAGALGFILYLAIYVVATILLVPGSLLTLGAGFVYGLAGGMALVFPASMLGATLAFVLGRYFARDWVSGRVDNSKLFRAVDDVTGRNGFKIVFLLRLSPLVPFALLNYTLGLTKVRLRDYVLASATGMLPGTLLYVYLGSLITNAAQLTDRGALPDSGVAGQVAFWGGLVATVGVTVFVTRLAKRALAQQLATDPQLTSDP